MKLVNNGITIDVNPVEAPRYLNAGFVKVIEQPVARQAAIEPGEAGKAVEAQEPAAVEVKQAKKEVNKAKAGKKVTNGNN